MERIERLRQKALENKICHDEFFYKYYKHYVENPDKSEEERYADAFYYAFSTLTPAISDDELIVGKYSQKLYGEDAELWQNKYLPEMKKRTEKTMLGQDSHMTIDYELILNIGLNGIIKKIDGYLLNYDENKRPFYNTCKRCLEAVIKHSENYADVAMKMAEETTDAKRKAELEKIAYICKKVPANPADNFYEAIQSVHFITHCLSVNPYKTYYQQFQLGHPDRYLLQYYNDDIQSGAITKEYAQLLFNCLGIQINMRVPNGLSSGYMVGGRDEKGNIVQNDLTLMGMQVIDDIKLVYPAVSLCYTEGMDDIYIEKACEILSHGCSHPAIFNDDVITKGLKSYGVSDAESHHYIHSTCVEITPVAASNAWVASPYENMAQILLDIMDREYNSFDDFMAKLFEDIDRHIKDNFERLNGYRKMRMENSMNPLLSCFVNDCLEKGLDIEHGGARYNWIMPSFVGMANLVDSIYVLKELVFEKKELNIVQFKEILDNDYGDNEPLRQRIANTIPKYGNDIDDVDKYYGLILNHIIAECEKYKPMHTNGRLIPSIFCFIRHETFGSVTGATPDGRRAGFPLGDGSGPCQGREMNGPTASILSSTKWEHHKLIGGVAVNMKFSKKSLGQNSVATMKSLVKTYLARGGFEIQINVIDNKTLEKAMASPELYKDLVVRVGGYSDYFVKLSENMQKEIILRTEHEI